MLSAISIRNVVLIETLDLDLRQKTFGRYSANRQRFMEKSGVTLPSPRYHDLPEVDQAKDVDALAQTLSEGGAVMMPADTYDFAARFAWVADRFGVNWQLVHDQQLGG